MKHVNKTYLLMIVFMIGIFISGCSKQSLQTNNDKIQNDNVVTANSTTVYKHFDKTINKSSIDFESPNLTMLYGVHNNENEVLVFYNDDELVTWANNDENGKPVIEMLNNISEALAMAKKMGEFEHVKKYGDVSDEYKQYLKSFVNSGGREVNTAANLFEHINYQGSYIFVGVPRWSLGSFNDKASSIQQGPGGVTLFDHKWWGGAKVMFFAVAYGHHPDLRVFNFNDKTSSVWIW